MILYKYCGPGATPLLRDRKLKVTRPIEFNDPYEFFPQIVGELSIEELLKCDSLNKHILIALQSDISLPVLREIIRQAAPEKLTEPQMATLQALARKTCDQVSKDFGVLCLSMRRDSVTMWAHYADLHRGFVVGFESTKFGSPAFHPVRYNAKRVSIQATWDLSSPAWDAGAKDVFLAKHRRWRHEREMRAIIPLAALTPDKGPSGADWYTCPIPPDSIVSITLGVRCSDQTKGEIGKAINALPSKPRLETALLQKNHYALDFEQTNL